MPSKFLPLPAHTVERLKELPQRVAILEALIAFWLFGSFAWDAWTPISDVDLAYLQTRDVQAIVERRLQTAIESCLNIGNHLIARLGLRPPQDYGDVFRILRDAYILPPKAPRRWWTWRGSVTCLCTSTGNLTTSAFTTACRAVLPVWRHSQATSGSGCEIRVKFKS